MANFIGSSRTNYFRIKPDKQSHARLEEIADEFDAALHGGSGENEGLWALLQTGENEISSRYDYDTDCDYDLLEELAPLLDNSIAVVVGSGAEKLRYVSGWAAAVRPDGKQVQLTLHDIYSLVDAELQTDEAMTCTEASY